jgi:putative alpha-1,2-mannosidase
MKNQLVISSVVRSSRVRFSWLIFSFLFFGVAVPLAAQPEPERVSRYVNPFIGTSNSGNTYPGAVAPWGMISVSPQNVDYTKPGYYAASYIFGGKKFFGFSHLNLSGVGCPDMGSVLMMPMSGELNLALLDSGGTLENEVATAGFYASTVNGVRADLSVSTHSAIESYTFRETKNHLVLNLGRSLSKVRGGMIRFVTPQHIEGYKVDGRFCGRSGERKVYFALELSQAPKDLRLFDDGKLKSPEQKQPRKFYDGRRPGNSRYR